MERRVAVVAMLAVAVALATVPTGGLAQSDEAAVSPGERFAGVVGVQGAEVQGEVDSRAFQARFDRAGSDASKAAVVAEETNRTRERLRELERRQERLREARANGNVSEGEFRARMAQLVAESSALQRQLDRTASASERVPDAALRERGVDPGELERLRTAAGNLTGPEVAAIARNVTGDEPGPPAGAGPGNAADGTASGPPDRDGPPSEAGDGGDGPSDAANTSADGQSTDGDGSPDRAGAGDGQRGDGAGPDGDGAGDRGDGADDAANESDDGADDAADESGDGSDGGPDGGSSDGRP